MINGQGNLYHQGWRTSLQSSTMAASSNATVSTAMASGGEAAHSS